jgi:prepilin-type N-terminal cleavage/methylation domain-containing protein
MKKTILKNKTGFTLAELLIVILLLGILSVSAITSYMNSTKTFEFLSSYKNVKAAINTAYTYSLAKKTVNETTPDRYGVLIEEKKLTVFADTGKTEFVFDTGNKSDIDNDKVLKEYDFSSTGYTMCIFGSSDICSPVQGANPIFKLPVAIFYETGSGTLTIKGDTGTGIDKTNVIVSKKDEKFIVIKFSDNISLTKYVYIIQVSGLPEESDTSTPP